MWNFYNSHSKPKADRRQNELFGQRLHSLLLFLFCLDCSCAPTESLITNSLSQPGSLNVKSNFLGLNIGRPHEMQRSVTQIPIWKPEVLKHGLKALREHSMTLVNSHKLYKHRFKRNLERLSQKNSTSTSELASTLTEMLSKVLDYESLYFWPDMENVTSVDSSNKRSLPDFTGAFLTIGPLTETTLDQFLKVPNSATIFQLGLSEAQTPSPERGPLSEAQTPSPELNSIVSQMHGFSDDKTFPAVGGHMQPMLTLMSAKPESLSSTGSLNKQEQAAASDYKFFVSSESSLPSKQYFPYRSRALISELNYTDLIGSPFAVTDGAKILTETSGHQSAKFTLKNSSGYANNGFDKLPNSSLETVEPYSATDKLVTDQFNLLDTPTHSDYETFTSGYLLPSLETSTAILQLKDIPVTDTSLTNSTLANSSVSVNTALYSQNSKPSLSAPNFNFAALFNALFYLRGEDNWDLASVTPQTLDIGLSSNKRNVRTATSSSTDSDTADISHMTMQRMENSSVASDTSVGTFLASSNLTVYVDQDSFSAPLTPHTSRTDQTSEHDRSLDLQRGTSRTFFASTLLPQTMRISKRSHALSWQTVSADLNAFSSITPSTYQVKDKARVLQIHDPANTQMPKSETLRLHTVYKSTEYKTNTSELSASNFVTPNNGSPHAEAKSTDARFQSTTPSFEYDAFNDVVIDVISQSTPDLTSTRSSTWSKKPLTTLMSSWRSRTELLGSSTIEPVQKLQSSQSTLYSTGAHMSESAPAKRRQVHTLDNLSNGSLPVTTRSSFNSTTVLTTLQRNISIKSVTEMEVESVKTSTTYEPSTKKYLVSKMLSTRDHMTAQQTSNSSRQPRSVTATITTPNQNIVTSSLYSTHLKTQTVSSTTKKPLIISTSTSRLTSLYQSSKMTLANTLSTSIVTPAPKVWVPKTIFPLKPTITTNIKYNTGQKIHSAPTSTIAVITKPLNFHLIGVSFSEQLLNRTSEKYRKLEREVKLVMAKIFFAKYQNDYLDTEIKAFLMGSVMVKSDIVFQRNSYVPSASDIIRTVLTDGTKTNYFGWSINGSTVELNGYTKFNLELETLPISFLVLHVGYIAVSQKDQDKRGFLDNLQKSVFYAANTSFPITNVSILEIRDVYGDLKVRGNLYLNATIHTNVQALMSSLLSLVNRNVDLSSIVVNGIGIALKVYSIHFRITNRKFVLSLLDMSSSESQLLSKDLSAVVQSVLQDSKPLQVVVREFKSGSVVCRGDLMYRLPAPSSWEILRFFLETLGSDGILASSTYKVDFKSITIGDSSPGLPNEYVDFPGFGVAIIVMCGLCILLFPIILFVCTKTKMLGHRQKATIQRRHDPVDQSHHFEMDNQAFRASIEQP